MKTLIHVLGSDIPHHNQTVLAYFNDVLSSSMPSREKRQFMVVSLDPTLASRYPCLNIQQFDNKKAIAKVIARQAKVERNCQFFFHGQFNVSIWLALLFGKIRRQQFLWHIWGADLYEDSTALKFRLFYYLRRLAFKRVGHVFATRGDLNYFSHANPAIPTTLLYFPTKMDPASTVYEKSISQTDKVTILVGNSGDKSNRHIEALQAIKKQFADQPVEVFVPMGYPDNNQMYIGEVAQAAEKYFPDGEVIIIKEKIAFNDYLTLLRCCDVGYFIFKRQQGIGTLCLLIQFGIPFIISRQNYFWQDLIEQSVPFLFYDDQLDERQLAAIREKMTLIVRSQIAFFNPNFIKGWQAALTSIGEQ
ncbi:MAG TPA: TDP-N-acetylfucosamine:lipid II N-acetylfucosaminyltransferase [Arsenophonus apicola]|uniref:TDP-N-acetylfucosamine:lipid II N-acetylfucosaminyltransferase n=1 Tax=Arsenophonus TaxID=637 RepID=UPI0015D861EA|nr:MULTISPECIES: TDP-N-acetylfucosamine:lipid II N-acetylfucosaminyltransferase [Arsenophonus]UBX29311.1 TDP-N-acetylfucosamine:lipid II N-acetylfucosaminyltransferase [Arsenophonus apicola]